MVRLQCKYCDRSFARSNALKVHELKHRSDADATVDGKPESIEFHLLESEREDDIDTQTVNEQ